VPEVPLPIYANVSGRYYFIYSQDANGVQTSMTRQLIETRAIVTRVLSAAANNKLEGK
jgi:predicted transcriptional regulator